MTKDELLIFLRNRHTGGGEWINEESGHREADKALLDYINDPEIREAYERIPKWYA